MRVKLQLVICHDDGHEETVTDVITLNKNNKRIEHVTPGSAGIKPYWGIYVSPLQRNWICGIAMVTT